MNTSITRFSVYFAACRLSIVSDVSMCVLIQIHSHNGLSLVSVSCAAMCPLSVTVLPTSYTKQLI